MEFLNTIAQNVSDFLNTVAPFVWILVAVALFGIGGACIIGTQQSREAAKAKAPYILAGSLIILGAVEIAKSITSMLSFTTV